MSPVLPKPSSVTTNPCSTPPHTSPFHYYYTRPPKSYRPPTINKNVRHDGRSSLTRPGWCLTDVPHPISTSATQRFGIAPPGPYRRSSNSICRMAPIGTNVYLQKSLEPNVELNDACLLSVCPLPIWPRPACVQPWTARLYRHKFARPPVNGKEHKAAPEVKKVAKNFINRLETGCTVTEWWGWCIYMYSVCVCVCVCVCVPWCGSQHRSFRGVVRLTERL